MYSIQPSNRFRRDLKSIAKRGYDVSLLTDVVRQLANGSQLPEKHRDHALTGNWAGYRDCRIAPDWILIYKIEKDILVLSLTRTGTHSDLEL